MNEPTTPHDLLVALLSVNELLERRSEQFFQPWGLSGAQFNILNVLIGNGGKMDQADLVQSLLVGKSSISIVLGRMFRAGLLVRKEHTGDRRRSILILTPKGRRLWEKVSQKYEAIVKDIFGILPKPRRSPLFNDLKSFYLRLFFLEEKGAGNAEKIWQDRFAMGREQRR
jgi:DNA-binding MarR family transcriptional regulator